MAVEITIFKDGYDVADPHFMTLNQALSRIKKGKSKDKVETIRSLTKQLDNTEGVKRKKVEKEIDKLKLSLPSVLFHGKFDVPVEKEYKSGAKKGKKYESKREDASLSKYSGFLVLDFDKCDAQAKKLQLMADPYVYACWISPSGKGVKAIVVCPRKFQNHYAYYDALIDRYPELDTTSKSISRLCFESYDPELHVNKKASLWDKMITKEQRDKVAVARDQRRNNKIVDIARTMVRNAPDGEKHDTLIKASKLLGGYVATGRVQESEAFDVLMDEIQQRDIKSISNAKEAIEAGLSYGKTAPLYDIKKIEKAQEFVIREDGTYDFLASEEDMDDYEQSYLNGTLEMGLTTGSHYLDQYWLFKKLSLVWVAGLDNTGKSFVAWYLATLAAMLHGWRVVIHSAENNDGQLRKKIKEFDLGKGLKDASQNELDMAQRFFKEHFRILTSKKMHTCEELLMKGEIVFDQGFKFDLLIADPYNALDVPPNVDSYRNDISSCNHFRLFKENYSAVWVIDHINTSAARNRDSNGAMKMPTKADVSGGSIKGNKTDDFLIVHRDTKGPDWMYVQVSVDKIKDTETGGKTTQTGDPVMIRMNVNKCGYEIAGDDPVKLYWQRQEKTYEDGLFNGNENEFDNE